MIPGAVLWLHLAPAQLLRHKLRTLLSFASVALAVALLVAIRIADFTMVRAFERIRSAMTPLEQAAPGSSGVFDYTLGQMRTISMGVTLVAAMIGLFIVFNSAAVSVAERSQQFGTLRALGARRRDVLATLLIESVVLGLAASLVGLAIGVLLADETVKHAVTSLNVLVQVIEAGRAEVPVDVWLLAPLLGVATTVLGTLAPARGAARVPPVTALSRTAAWRGQTARVTRWFVVAVVLAIGGTILVVRPDMPRSVSIAAFGVVVFALALALPQLILWLAAPVRGLVRRACGVETWLALDNIASAPARTSLTVVAFAGSLAIVVGVAGMLLSLRTAIWKWMDDIFAFDLSVQAHPLITTAYGPASFPDTLLTDVQADPRVLHACGVRGVFQPYAGRSILLIALDAGPFFQMLQRSGRLSDDASHSVIAALQRGDVVVSDNFSYLYGVRAGDTIDLDSPAGRRSFRVGQVREDYSWPLGVVLIDRAPYVAIWGDHALTYLDVQARDPADVAGLHGDLKRNLRAGVPLYVHTTASLKVAANNVLEDWFRLANAQVLLAVIIGGVGVANTLLVSVLGQARQVGLMRAIGATRRQVQRVLLVEAGILGLLSGVLGVLMGIAIAGLVAPIFMLRDSGYRFPFIVPWTTILLVIASGLIIALVASLLPLRTLRRVDVVQSIAAE